MSKHILCAVDLTHIEDARALVGEAARLADLQSAILSVVTVLPDYGSSFVGSFFQEGTLKDATLAAQKALHELADGALASGDAVQCIVKIGSVYEETLEAAVECEADLIVVGARKPDLADKILGPNAARVARYAKVSVLVARL